jgi:hypothetical protein
VATHPHCTALSGARCPGVDRHVAAEVLVGTLGLSVPDFLLRGGPDRPDTAGGNGGRRPLAGSSGMEDAFLMRGLECCAHRDTRTSPTIKRNQC